MDGTPPAQAPLVSSNDYTDNGEHPWGGPGLPGTFTFDAQGDPDVVSYRHRFSWSDRTGVVQAPSPGAAVSLQLAPQTSRDDTLEAPPIMPTSSVIEATRPVRSAGRLPAEPGTPRSPGRHLPAAR